VRPRGGLGQLRVAVAAIKVSWAGSFLDALGISRRVRYRSSEARKRDCGRVHLPCLAVLALGVPRAGCSLRKCRLPAGLRGPRKCASSVL
jgi:hypothetical protein